MRWVELVSGERNPIEPEEVHAAPGVVAVRASTGKGKVLAESDMADVERWAERYGVTFHRSHFSSARCAAAERVHREQQALPI
jgi:hypothetical protein